MTRIPVVFPERAQKWGILSLLFAVAICLFKWTPFSGILSFVPLLGYLSIGKWGKPGLIISSLCLMGLGVPFLISSSDRLFFFCFLCALLTSYYLLYLEREEALSTKEERKEQQGELLQDLEKWKKGTASLKATLVESEAKASQEKRGLQREVEKLSLELDQTTSSLHQSIDTQKELQLRLEKIESEYQALQCSLYKDTELEPAEEPSLLEEWRYRYEGLQQEVEESKRALAVAIKDASDWESKAIALEKQQEATLYQSSQELDLFITQIQALSEESRSLETQVESLQELVSLLLPFARTHLYQK